MTVTINGTTGVAGVDGTASTPAIQGNDTNTGIFFPAADTIAFAEGGAEVARFDSNGNLGVGTTSPTNFANYKTIAINGTSGGVLDLQNNGTSTGLIFCDNQLVTIRGGTSTPLVFQTNGANERMRIDSSGNLRLGTTTTAFGGGERFSVQTSNGGSGTTGVGFQGTNSTLLGLWNSTTSSSTMIAFASGTGGAAVGSISTNGTNTSYNTGPSDYRLKKDVAPLTNALAKIEAIKPVKFVWKDSEKEDIGFIAHELQTVIPDCVTGEKDAVDSEGNPEYQSVFPSPAQMVATLVAAIQEQQAIITDLKARIETLENK